MRYRRGSIALSSQLDAPLLRTVYRAGHVTFDQLYDCVYPVREKSSWDTLSWRVRRLVAHGLLDQARVAGLNGIVLSLGEAGELYLQSRELFLVERASRSRGVTKRHQIWHDVDLFGIQLALRRAGVVAMWESESEVRAANDFTTNHYAKDYDAVVTFQCGARRGMLALEYERTPKWTKEYERISKDLQLEARVSAFLYLVPNIELRSLLLHALRNSGRRMLIAIASEFSRDPRNAGLIDIRTHLSCRLEDCLD
jgi:hypothetical protein